MKTISGAKTQTIALYSGSLLFQIIQVGTFPILISQFLSESSLSNFSIGIYVSVAWIVVFLAGPFVPGLISGVGPYRANFFAFCFTVVSLVLLALSPTPVFIALASVAMGMGLIIRWIVCDTLVVHVSASHVRGRMIGWHEALMGLGIGLGPLLFVGTSLTAVVWICLAIAVLGQVAFLTLDSTQTLESNQTEGGGQGPKFLIRVILTALVAAFLAGFIENSAIALLPLYFEHVDFTLKVSAILVSSFGFGGTLLQPALGYIADRWSYYLAQMLCITFIIGSSMFVLLFTEQVVVSLVALFFLGGAAGGLNTLAVIEAGRSQSAPQIPAAMTAIAMLYTLGGIAGPVASGASLDLFQNQGMIMLFIASGVVLAMFLLFHRYRGAAGGVSGNRS
ncbi:MAG: MFS transporter [Hyphomicrobiales bacterium]